MDNVIKQMTTQLKQVKQESHLKLLELNKANSRVEELEFDLNKLRKENEFLQKKNEALELEKLDTSKNQRFSDIDNAGHHDDLAEMDEISNKSSTDYQQKIEDLQHEILILQKSNEMLKSGQSTDK